jgi:uncharacterized protein (TIRG00374 family)
LEFSVKKIAVFFKKYGTWALLAINFAIMAYIISNDPDFSEGFRTLETLSLGFVVLCFVVFSLTYLGEGAQLYFIIKMLGGSLSLYKSVRAVIIERYYNAITPTNIGGQPALIVYLMANGLSGTLSASAMSIRFIMYQITICFFLALMFIFMPLLNLSVSPLIFTALIIGAIFSLAMPLILLLCALWPKVTYRSIGWLCRMGKKLRLLKDSDLTYAKIVDMLNLYSQSMRMINLKYTFIVVLFAVVQFFAAMSVPFFVCFACAVNINYIQSVAYTTVLYTAVSYMPTPGATGIAEGVFYSLFSGIIPGTFIMVALLLWRVSSYYLTVVLGFIESGASAIESYLKRREKRIKV